eukprot:CAMPEP_0178453840 /NCGR_PEP_ID=MMETSP0689_2-20121128/45024_1 /TAXON_ID=160604 /ORGANISM="Amphidinium massartii, Strain CS-259" /LENGTH=292 /DNA_ID=CAMNT_0020079703 /DNA_START=192 /DNA_END=1070 /DNA_ORIENTATION=+
MRLDPERAERATFLLGAAAAVVLLTLSGCYLTWLGSGCGTFFIGSYPWDVYIVEHFLCADAIFYGGCAWGCGNVVISWTLRHTAAIESWDPCPWLRSWQLPMSIFTCVDLFGIAVLYSAAYDMDGRNGFFVWEWWLGVQQLAREDFAAYCEGRGWHEKGFINGMAVLEWVLLGCCFLAMVLSMPDVYLYQSWKQGCFPPKDSPAPRLAMEKLAASLSHAGVHIFWRSHGGSPAELLCLVVERMHCCCANVLGPRLGAAMAFLWWRRCSCESVDVHAAECHESTASAAVQGST